MMPKRIKLSRKKGYKKPADAVNVARPTKYGNPFNWQDYHFEDDEQKKYAASRDYEMWLEGQPLEIRWPEKRQWILDHIEELRGKDLACWCGPDDHCHADVLLKLANPKGERVEAGE